MRVVTVHRGARDGYQVARALQERGLLDTLVTDFYSPVDRPWARAIDYVVPRKVSAALLCRHCDGLPSRSVRSCTIPAVTAFLANEKHWLPFDLARTAVRRCDDHLGREAGRLATRRNAALLSYSYYAYSAFRHYTGEQPRILFQLHPHPASVRNILAAERDLNPDCAPSLNKEWELSLPESDYQRLCDETLMAQYWIVASQFTKDTLISGGVPADRINVIPYGIDLNRYSIRKNRVSGGPLKLLFVGTLGQRKGIKYLLQALDLFPSSQIELTACGRAVDDLALFQNTRAKVHLFPSISAAGLIDAYRSADVFVFPSLAEGFGHVLLEAMASGLPVISTARTAAPDLIRHGQEGFIVEPGSVPDLAFHIERFLSRPEILLPMSAAARRRAEQFTWRRFRQSLAGHVNSLVHPTGARVSANV